MSLTVARHAAETKALRTSQIMGSIRIDAESGCWEWLGKISPHGYGWLAGIGAHRIAYETFVGPIPRGLVIDHTCHVPDACVNGDACPHRRCVNPHHMEPVTAYENWRRGALGLKYLRARGLAA